jgi:hypothetical protein
MFSPTDFIPIAQIYQHGFSDIRDQIRHGFIDSTGNISPIKPTIRWQAASAQIVLEKRGVS